MTGMTGMTGATADSPRRWAPGGPAVIVATMHTRRPATWTLAALLLLSAGPARADVVGPPPRNCPVGSSGDSCHGGPFCRPSTCLNDTECSEGSTCQDVMACIGGIQCGGLEGGGDPPIDTFEGLCDKGSCSGEAECQAIKQCLPAGDPTTGGSTGGGSAGTDSAGTGGGSASGTGGGSTGGSPTSGATSNGPSTGSGEASGDGTAGGGDKGGCACTTTNPTHAPLLALAFLPLLRRRR